MGGRKLLVAAPGLLLGASLLASCGQRQVVVPHARPIGLVSFDQDAAVARNGALVKPEVGLVCGSDQTTFGTELVDTPPNEARVPFEWGAIGEDTAAESGNLSRAGDVTLTGLSWPGLAEPKQALVSGTVVNFELSRGDLTFNHPWGKDMTFDVKPDRPFAKTALRLGKGEDEDGPPPGTIHLEIQQGLVPHAGSGIQDFLPGFSPEVGDRMAAFGPWIIDCGHDDWHSELHELTFLAFGHAEGDTTVVHTYYNAYRQSQYLSGNPDIVNQLLDFTRWSDTTVKPFPTYLVGELLRVGHVKEPFHDRLEAHQMLKANFESPAPWYVCAPGQGSALNYSYSFTVRSGVTISAAPNQSTGCVKFTADLGFGYSPAPPQRKDCLDRWSELNAQLQAALGNPNIDVRQLIEAQVPKSFIPAVERDPLVDCYDPLVVAAPTGARRSISTSDTQPYPFYGEIKVSWGS